MSNIAHDVVPFPSLNQGRVRVEIRSLLCWLFLFCSILSISAQDIERNVKERLQSFFQQYEGVSLERGTCRLDSVRIRYSQKAIDIYVNNRFAFQPFRPETTERIYQDVHRLMPGSIYYYKMKIWTGGRSIEDLIPNYYRAKRDLDLARLYNNALLYRGNPWVTNVNYPCKRDMGLRGHHLTVWQSHGRYYANSSQQWEWQRPRLFCTTEDLFTQSFVIPYLIPMLEHAGAYVYTPRERDVQKAESIVDNDGHLSGEASLYIEQGDRKYHWQTTSLPGFAHRKLIYEDGENPFKDGTARFISTKRKKGRAFAEWIPDIPQSGRYAVYVSYQSLPQSVSDAQYLVFHKGGVTEFKVNQQMGGNTWVYLGTFEFDQGRRDYGMVVLTNKSRQKGVVCADAVRFGGGMGSIARNGKLSGFPRYLEGARYSAQWNGMPFSVYGREGSDNDYADDINVRSRTLNYLSGGSLFNPQDAGLKVPIELSMALHSDAGVSNEDHIIGSLGIYTADFNGGRLATGLERYASRDLSDLLLSQLQLDIQSSYGITWTRRSLWNRNYSETRLPVVPSTIVELLSHQNFADMCLGHEPNFKFIVGRALYKGILRYLTNQYGDAYVVQPLPVSHFAVELEGKKRVKLSWIPENDPLEPTAKPDEYIVYTRIGHGGFDNGVRVDRPSYTLKVEPGVVYSFRVTAVNRGGESFPSEILSAYYAFEERGKVLIVNGFDRVSAPAVVNTPEQAGFDLSEDPGVPYLYDISLCGKQIDFERAHAGTTLGQSTGEWEGKVRAGNVFDYPFVHGKAIQAAGGYSFASCSDEAVEDGILSLEGYDVVDYILGLEKSVSTNYLMRKAYYKTFTSPMQRMLTSYCHSGGHLLVSGAYVGRDMMREGDRSFVRDVLKYTYVDAVAPTDTLQWTVRGPGGEYHMSCQPNDSIYILPSADGLLPVANSFAAMSYAGNDETSGAAVAYHGVDYKTFVMGFPFEAIHDEKRRSVLMSSILQFLVEE